MDRGLRAAGLWCFPLLSDTSAYLYLPNNASLALNENGQPEFSFIRYVNDEKDGTPAGNSSIAKAGGGGVLSFLVTYDTKPMQLAAALKELKERTGNRNVRLNGPVVFSQGRYALISSIVNPETGQGEKRLFAVGDAPLLAGSKMALSFSVDAKDSKLLLESFKTRTPDLSLAFDMSFSGLSDAYDAELTIDWEEVRKTRDIKGGVNIYVVSVQAEYAIEELMRKNAIRLKTTGGHAPSEALLSNVYNKLLNMLFEPAQPEQNGQQNSAPLTQAIAALVGGGSGGGLGIGLNAGFRWRDLKTTGSSTISFNTRAETQRHHYITFNIGNFWDSYGSDDRYFRTVSLEDPLFQKRHVFVGIDGEIAPEFGRMINNVTVTLKKVHDDGTETIGQMMLNKNNYEESFRHSLVYGSLGDSSRTRWLNYQYQTSFQFVGGKSFHTPWLSGADPLINVYVPFSRKTILIDGDSARLAANKVKAVVVQVEYPFFGEQKQAQLTLRPGDNLADKKIEITLPLNTQGYRYTLTWIIDGAPPKTATAQDNSGIIFIDTL